MKTSTVLMCGLLLMACVATSSAVRRFEPSSWTRHIMPPPIVASRDVEAAEEAAPADAGDAGDADLEQDAEFVQAAVKEALTEAKEALDEALKGLKEDDEEENGDGSPARRDLIKKRAWDLGSGWSVGGNGLQWQSNSGRFTFNAKPSFDGGSASFRYSF
ncbi:uncharacterized protein LOC143290496 [Babylonia areolata]|uniref:uncharacterized protein LOC143290496 n=1 Tax=Babylonia areolata TaxID=304850 RepID=UPI003FD37688